MNKSKLFITGGTGFIGKSILKNIMIQSEFGQIEAITILSRNPDAFLKNYPEFAEIKNLSFVQGDILTFEFPSEKYTHIIHAATDTSNQSIEDSLKYFDDIFIGTCRMLDFSVACGASKFLLTSSGAIYGPQPDNLESIPETYLGAPSTVDPNSVYGHAKRASEQLCRIYHDKFNLDCVIARCFTFIGDYMPLNGQYAIGNFIRDALSDDIDRITVLGDGSPIRSYLHTDDLSSWLLKILYEGKSCYPYNVGSDEEITMADLAYLVRDLLAPEKSIVISEKRTDYAGRSRYIPSIKRAYNELNLHVEKSLSVSIKEIAKAINI